MDKNIYAYTGNTHPYPPFVSLNNRNEGFQLTVRPISDSAVCAPTATVTMEKAELVKMARDILAYMGD